LKHVATLATGSILTIATLLQSVFKQPVHSGWVPLAVFLFLGCIAISLLTFGVLVLSYPRPGFLERTETTKNVVSTGLVFTCLAFVGGVTCLFFFFNANWSALYPK